MLFSLRHEVKDNEAERRLFDAATTDEEREILRKLLDHQHRVSLARSAELFIQGLAHIHDGLQEQLRLLTSLTHAFAAKLMAEAALLFLGVAGLYLVFQKFF